MDVERLQEARTRYLEALEHLRDVARRTERQIGTEALVLLQLFDPNKTSHHFLGSQFGIRTWMYILHLGGPHRAPRFEVALGMNDQPAPVAGPDASPAAMLTFLEDAPALLTHIRQSIEQIRTHHDRPEAA